MLNVLNKPDIDSVETGRKTLKGAGRTKATEREIPAGAFLYQDGDRRTSHFRVESGALCHYMLWDDGRHDVIEMALPGDIVGLGHLAHHVSSAQAIMRTTVTPLSEEEFEEALASDDVIASRLASAADREFDTMRDRTLSGIATDPTKRVASFLLATAQLSAPESGDSTLVTDELACGYVADKLNLSTAKLADALVALERQGLISTCGRGLRLNDVDALAEFADAD